MNRRSFVKSLLAASLVPLLPSPAAAGLGWPEWMVTSPDPMHRWLYAKGYAVAVEPVGGVPTYDFTQKGLDSGYFAHDEDNPNAYYLTDKWHFEAVPEVYGSEVAT